MDLQKITKQGKILNIVLIVMTIIMFIFLNIGNRVATGGTADTSTILLAETILLWIYRIVSAVCLALSIMLMIRAEKKVKGLGLLVASAAVSLAFAVLGLMLGILVWILSGLSLRKLAETVSETSFKDKLNTPDNQTTTNDTL